MPSKPGMLYVTMQPKPGLSLDQFHEWYNNEHGPTRLRLPHIFANGLRYRATDSQEPTFLAVYDVTSMHHLATPAYTNLRENRSPRESETIGQVDVVRSFLDLVEARQTPDFVPPEELTDAEAAKRLVVSAEITPKGPGDLEHLLAWHQEEHIEMISRVPGWLRTRLYRSSVGLEDGQGPEKIFVLHEFAKGVFTGGGPEYAAARATPRTAEAAAHVGAVSRRFYELFYVFGPAPRDLTHLSALPTAKSFSTADASTRTEAGESAVITSYVATKDGLKIPYRLEGNASPDAPTVAFSNSLLTSLHMWDGLVAILKRQRPDLRVLRYDTRGRHAGTPQTPATLEMLADDVAGLLRALRVPRLHALVGVSMGGATTLEFALRHPGLLDRFVACDCNAASSAANTAAWRERIATAESPAQGDDDVPGIRRLAIVTVERWFHPDTVSGKPDLAREMADMVAANDVDGFRYGCQALWDYDLKPRLGACRVPGLLVVGEGDGKGALAKAMDGFKGLVGGSGGVELKVVPSTGHLPMFEDAAAFWESIKAFI